MRLDEELGLVELGLGFKSRDCPITSQFNHEIELDFEFKPHWIYSDGGVVGWMFVSIGGDKESLKCGCGSERTMVSQD
jgi:hypothetical protein